MWENGAACAAEQRPRMPGMPVALREFSRLGGRCNGTQRLKISGGLGGTKNPDRRSRSGFFLFVLARRDAYCVLMMQ